MKPPLVVDLDGTLIKTDLLYEASLAYIKHRPWRAFAPLKWMASGKAWLKTQLAKQTSLNTKIIPYNQEVIDLIKSEKAKGRQIILATASHKIYAEQIAAHLKLFDHVIATDETINLSSHRKRDALVKTYGEKGFDYAGNSKDDCSVWQAARYAYIVNAGKSVQARAQKNGNVEKIFHAEEKKNTLQLWTKALRLHQWVKNLLIFVPLIASHQLLHSHLWLKGLLAFICFGLCASSVYLLNDLLDLEDDRLHETKSQRPFASGALPIQAGLVTFPLLLIFGLITARIFLSWQFAACLSAYYILTLTYSLFLKRIMLIDVLTLAMLYTLRIFIGIFAFHILPTFWMLAFSMFIFLSLALVKRYTELRNARHKGTTNKTHGRGYYPSDLEIIATLGTSAGYLSVMVLALYIQDPSTAVLYNHPDLIWLACPLLLFWISRLWMLAHRGKVDDDPVIFAIQDRASLVVGILFCFIFWIAS